MYSSEEKAVSRRRRTMSFSSSLLDAVYRSIDDSKSVDDLHYEHDHYRRREEQSEEGKTTPTKKRQSKNDKTKGKQDKELENLRRAMMIESWVKKLNNSTAQPSSTVSTSASSSSESLWSSSERDSRPRTNPKPERQKQRVVSEPDQDNRKPCYGFSRTTKLKAMKIYGELKKVKQPISPGGRIATFLNSFFSSGNVKKAKMCYVGPVEDVTVASDPTPSYSKSCLVKPQSSSRTEKRSVRFYPVSVVLGEDGRETHDPRLMPSSVMKKKMIIDSICDDHRRREAEDDGDDDESCSSSDLFEIDHLVGVGLRYSEELPVYETTSLKTNHAIAHGLIY